MNASGSRRTCRKLRGCSGDHCDEAIFPFSGGLPSVGYPSVKKVRRGMNKSPKLRPRLNCRLAVQGGTRLLLKFNGLGETEVPFLAFQSRLAKALRALKMELVDRSINRGSFERDVRFAQVNSRSLLAFQSRLQAPRISHGATEIL